MVSIPIVLLFGCIEACLVLLLVWKGPHYWLQEEPFIPNGALVEGTLLGEILRHPLRPEDVPAVVRRYCGPLPARE